MKKTLFIILSSVFLFSALPVAVLAQLTSIDFFFSPTCPHCAEEEIFLDKLQEEYPNIVINRYSVFESKNVELLKEYYKNYEVPKSYYGMVPATFTAEEYFIGFTEKIGEDIRGCVDKCETGGGVSEENTSFLDTGIDPNKYSLPVLAVVLGTLDGFNVCSLGALVLILGLVLSIKSRKKVLLFGGVFIITTAVVYGIMIFIWYKIFAYLVPYMNIMKILIGLLGIGGGIYFFNQFLKFKKYGPTCEVSAGQGIVTKFSNKFKESLNNSKNLFLLLGSVFLFALMITVIEFPCSAVIPVAFAGILADAGLSGFQHLLYIIIFLIFYMLDEVIVFLIAFFTMKIWLSSSKAVTWAALAEAIILFGLGLYYLL